MSLLARDGFRDGHGVWGGPVVDVGAPWCARDKVQHLVLGGVVWLVLWTAGIAPLPRAATFLGLSIAWELLELARLLLWRRGQERVRRRLEAEGQRTVIIAPGPWPPIADLFSWRDIVAGAAGAVVLEVAFIIRGMP